jgi:hypothetical protein
MIKHKHRRIILLALVLAGGIISPTHWSAAKAQAASKTKSETAVQKTLPLSQTPKGYFAFKKGTHQITVNLSGTTTNVVSFTLKGLYFGAEIPFDVSANTTEKTSLLDFTVPMTDCYYIVGTEGQGSLIATSDTGLCAQLPLACANAKAFRKQFKKSMKKVIVKNKKTLTFDTRKAFKPAWQQDVNIFGLNFSNGKNGVLWGNKEAKELPRLKGKKNKPQYKKFKTAYLKKVLKKLHVKKGKKMKLSLQYSASKIKSSKSNLSSILPPNYWDDWSVCFYSTTYKAGFQY